MMIMMSASNDESRFDLLLSEIGSELIHQFHHYWLRICCHGRLPSRAEIDPANFKRILPNVILANIERDPFRVHYRLCGTRVTEFCGNLTGQYLDQMGTPDLWSTAGYLRQYQLVVEETRPVFGHDWIMGRFGIRHQVQSGIWPLASDGRTVDMCVAVEDYLKLRRAELEPSAVLQAF